MKRALLFREKDLNSQEWVCEVSMNRQNLQEGGSFTNALIRRFDKALAPILLQIFIFLDRNSNLELLLPDSLFQNDKPLSNLWLDIYCSQGLCQNVLSHTLVHPVVATSAKKFTCQFPFSWIIFNYINSKMDEGQGEHIDMWIVTKCIL